jgi:hypothetical protein
MTEPPQSAADAKAEEASTNDFDLREAFLAKQNALTAALNVTVGFTPHGTTIGDASEANWVAMLRELLPGRYGVGPIFAVDARGRQSQQIDVGIYDRQYAPLWFETPGGVLVIPAESVYAAFEVKPEINKTYLDYAGEKVASVRALHRTSAEVRHAGGVYPPQDPATKPILGGILGVRSGWTSMEGRAAVRALAGLSASRRVDVGIALDALSFDNDPRESRISYSPPGMQLIYFALRLFARLQGVGTALAVDIGEYQRSIDVSSSEISGE